MKVYQEIPPYTVKEPLPFHLIEKSEWVKGDPGPWSKLIELELTAFCDQKFRVKHQTKRKVCIYVEYVKDIHRKKLCPVCVKMIKLQSRTLKTESERNQ